MLGWMVDQSLIQDTGSMMQDETPPRSDPAS
jgi:hypothetical protein